MGTTYLIIAFGKTHETMKTIEINLRGQALQWNELSPEQQRLIDIAKEQTQHAYCPYSHFFVLKAMWTAQRLPLWHTYTVSMP